MKEVIRAENITKSFGMVKALDNVSIKVDEGEVVGLLGDNGAGKTTLLRVLCGIYKPDAGNIYFDGNKVQFRDVRDALKAGIAVIHQDLALLENLSIAENLFLARESFIKLGLVKLADKKTMMREAKKILEEFGFTHLNPNTPVKKLSGGERQSIAISRCVYFKARLILMDEPTTNLSLKESEHVLEMIKKLKKEKVSVILVSHNLAHVFSVANRIVILERGRKIVDTDRISIEEAAAMIKGLPLKPS
jgi:simple sugar transport system ATP-binding protein